MGSEALWWQGVSGTPGTGYTFPGTGTPLHSPSRCQDPSELPAPQQQHPPASPYAVTPRPHTPLFPWSWELLQPHSCLSSPPYPLFLQYQGPPGPHFQPSLLSPDWDSHFLYTGRPCIHLSLTLGSPDPLPGFPSFPWYWNLLEDKLSNTIWSIREQALSVQDTWRISPYSVFEVRLYNQIFVHHTYSSRCIS